MKFSLSRSLTTYFTAITVLLLACLDANAQQSWFGEAYSRSDSNIESLYNSNSQGPLGGLFAPGFTRTLTLLGGLNFPSDQTSEDFTNVPGVFPAVVPNPFALDLDDSGYALSFAFGRRHSHALRSEIEVAFRSNDIILPGGVTNGSLDDGGVQSILEEDQEDGSVNVTSLMKNFIRDFSNSTRFTPYAGVGIGLSYIDIEAGEATSIDGDATFQDDQTLFSYQAIGGVATQLNSVADLIVEYRFLGTSSVEFDGLDQDLSYNTSTLFFGVKFEY